MELTCWFRGRQEQTIHSSVLQDLSDVPGEESGPSALLLVLLVGVCRPPCSTADSGASCSVGTTGQSRGQGERAGREGRE